jgi:7-cyano-7-deazaguanine synthase
MSTKALVLVSGGIDSAVTLWWAKSRGWRTTALTFMYPGRQTQEIHSCRRLCKAAGVQEIHEFSIPFIDRPKLSQNCYIPQKNLMYYGIASSLAIKIQADYICGGHVRHDSSLFADAQEGYLSALGKLLLRDRAGRRVKFRFPLIHKDKRSVIKLGRSLGVPFQLTWSCLRNGRSHCWRCESCAERIEGFEGALVIDPLR